MRAGTREPVVLKRYKAINSSIQADFFGYSLSRMSRKSVVVWVCALAMVCAGVPARLAAQIGAGTLTGVVSDRRAAAVPGATVTVTAVDHRPRCVWP